MNLAALTAATVMQGGFFFNLDLYTNYMLKCTLVNKTFQLAKSWAVVGYNKANGMPKAKD